MLWGRTCQKTDTTIQKIVYEQNIGAQSEPYAKNLGGESFEGESIGGFIELGQSLDLYFVNDTSGSLESSDPFCIRYDAIVKFQKDLKLFLGDKGDVRATFITFSKSAQDIRTFENFIQVENSELDSLIQPAICKRQGPTIPSAGFRKTIAKYNKLKLIEEKDRSAAIFFTDGGGGEHFASSASSLRMRNVFDHRVYSLLLLQDQDYDKDKFDPLRYFNYPRFVRYLSKHKKNILHIAEADELSEAISSLFKIKLHTLKAVHGAAEGH